MFLAVELLEKMLVLDTDKRITAAEALADPYFAQYHDPDDEPEADPFDQSFESRELDIEEWKRESAEEKNDDLFMCKMAGVMLVVVGILIVYFLHRSDL